MLVIEGKAGKSRRLEKIVNQLSENDCVIIDMIGINCTWNNNRNSFVLRGSHEDIIKWLKVSVQRYLENEQTLVLYVNCPKEKLKSYLELEDYLFNKGWFSRFMITVQNDDLEELIEYNTFKS